MKRPLKPVPRTALVALGLALAAPLAHADATVPDKGDHGKGTADAAKPLPPSRMPLRPCGGSMPAPRPPSAPLPRAILILHPHGPGEPCFPLARKA
jgi:hypothetical protein